MPDKKLIQVEDLKISFLRQKQWFEVVKGISFDINKGEIVGLVGESGSGKSVTSLAIMGLLPEKYSKINGGKITLYENQDDSIDLTSLKEKDYQSFRGNKIAMIFQEPKTACSEMRKAGYGNDSYSQQNLKNRSQTKSFGAF